MMKKALLTLLAAAILSLGYVALRLPSKRVQVRQTEETANKSPTSIVKMDGVVYCDTKTALWKAWAEPELTPQWLAVQGCGYLRKGEQVTIEVRDPPMIRLNGGRWTSYLAVEAS